VIPWNRFNTPQDAYQWAKGASGTMLLVQFRTRDHAVLKLNFETMSWDQEALCCRGNIITTHEVRQALDAFRRRPVRA